MDKAQGKEIKLFENEKLNLSIRAIENTDGSISVNLEDVAIGFGWFDNSKFAKSGEKYIRWSRINNYCKELNFPHKCGKDDFIPESLFYMLGMKANNERAIEFQKWLAIEVIPAIRKTGSFISKKDTNQLSFFDNISLESNNLIVENANAMKIALETSKLFNKMIDENKLDKSLKLTIAQEVFKNIGITIPVNKKDRRRSNGMLFKVEQYNCVDIVKSLLIKRFSYEQISEELEKSNIKISKASIARYAKAYNLNIFPNKGGDSND